MIGGSKPKDSSTPPSAASPAATPGTPAPLKKLLLNSADSLFKETRDLSFRVLGPLLHKKAEYIKETYSERHAAQTVNEMHSFMQRFKTAHAEHSLLQTHINLAERISQVFKSKAFDRRVEVERMMLEGEDLDACEEYVEQAICRSEPIAHVLRLFCLLSLTGGGIRPKKFDHLRREFLHTYGFHLMFTLNNLERLGMLCSAANLRQPNQGGRGWAQLRKGLKLTTPADKVDVQSPQDIGYIFNGYAPLSVRLIEVAHKPGWRRYEELLSFVPGKSFEFRQEASGVNANPVNLLEMKQPGHSGIGGAAGLGLMAEGWKGITGGASGDAGAASTPSNAATKDSSASTSSGRKKPLTLVVFLGGAIMSELSALRFLSEREDHARDHLVATTKLTNGAGFVEALIEQVANKLNGGTGMAGQKGTVVNMNPYAVPVKAAPTPVAAVPAAAMGRR